MSGLGSGTQMIALYHAARTLLHQVGASELRIAGLEPVFRVQFHGTLNTPGQPAQGLVLGIDEDDLALLALAGIDYEPMKAGSVFTGYRPHPEVESPPIGVSIRPVSAIVVHA